MSLGVPTRSHPTSRLVEGPVQDGGLGSDRSDGDREDWDRSKEDRHAQDGKTKGNRQESDMTVEEEKVHGGSPKGVLGQWGVG